MDGSVQPLYEKLRIARRSQGLTQSELAREAKCAQSAISMYESGRLDVLSRRTVKLIAERLGVQIPRASTGSDDALSVASTRLKCCPVDDCPTNIPYIVRGKLHFSPALVEARADEPTRCAMCGEVLEQCCPNESCGAPLSEGGCCSRCGASYVAVTRVMRGPLEEWVVRRRVEISELRAMGDTQRLGA